MNIAIFASGSGSNAEAIMQSSADGKLEAEIGLVFSNNRDAKVLERADKF